MKAPGLDLGVSCLRVLLALAAEQKRFTSLLATVWLHKHFLNLPCFGL